MAQCPIVQVSLLEQCCPQVCAPSDVRTSLGLFLYSFIILTGFVSIDLGLKRMTIFVCSCPVSVVSSSSTIAQKEHFDIHMRLQPSVFVDQVWHSNRNCPRTVPSVREQFPDVYLAVTRKPEPKCSCSLTRFWRFFQIYCVQRSP